MPWIPTEMFGSRQMLEQKRQEEDDWRRQLKARSRVGRFWRLAGWSFAQITGKPLYVGDQPFVRLVVQG